DAGPEVPGAARFARRRARGRFDEVSNVDVVAGLISVAANFGRASTQDRLRKDRDDSRLSHSVLTRTVHIGIPEHLGLESVDDLVVVEVVLDRELGATVG